MTPDKSRKYVRRPRDVNIGAFRTHGTFARFFMKTNKQRSSSNKSRKVMNLKLQKQLDMIKKATLSIGDEPTVKVNISSISDYFICSICKGYFYKATTITECLHTFCKDCLTKHLTFHLNCPKCKIIIHPTDPFVNVRPDSTIQDLLYKLLPDIEKEELKKEKEFLDDQARLNPEQNEFTPTSLINQNKRKYLKKQSVKDCQQDLNKIIFIGVELNFIGSYLELAEQDIGTLFLGLPSTTCIKEIQLYLHNKLQVSANAQVNIFVEDYILNPGLTIERIWDVFTDTETPEGPLVLQYAVMPCKYYFSETNSNLQQDKIQADTCKTCS